MNLTEEQLRYALRQTAAEIPAAAMAPLRLPAGADGLAEAGTRLRDPAARRRSGMPTPARLAPLAAAAAVLAVVAVVASVTIGSPPPPRPPGPLSARPLLARVPEYYMAVTRSPRGGPFNGVVKATRTGATVATVRPPRPYRTFTLVAGAADDRTFVLAAQPYREPAPISPVRLFLARFSPADHKITLTALPIPNLGRPVEVTGLALSPDGRTVAVALATGSPHQPVAQVRVYSLATGAARAWQDTGIVDMISWARNGALALNYTPSQGEPPDQGIWLLSTAGAGGSLRAHSRLAVCAYQPGGMELVDVGGPGIGGLVTSNGASIVAPATRTYTRGPGPTCARAGRYVGPGRPWRYEVFSTATGRLTRVIVSVSAPSGAELWWVNSTGTVAVIEWPQPHQLVVFGVASGGRIATLPPGPVAELTAGIAF